MRLCADARALLAIITRLGARNMLSTQRYTVTALLLVTPSCVLRKRPARLFLDQLTGTPLLTFPLFRSASCLYFREEMQLLASTCDISSIDERHSARVLLDLRSAPPQNRTRTTFDFSPFSDVHVKLGLSRSLEGQAHLECLTSMCDGLSRSTQTQHSCSGWRAA